MRGKGVTLLVHMSRGDRDPIASIVKPPFVFVNGDSHYDGAYYYAIARDPIARGAAHTLIDFPAYRYGHPGYGWLGFIASAGGQPRAVPYALLFVSLLGMGVAGWAAAVLAVELGMSAWWGLSIALNPGLLFAVSVDTSETIQAALVLLAFLAWSRKRWLWAGVVIALACFTKEPLLLLPLSLFLWEGARFASGFRPSHVGRRVAALVCGPVLYGAWIGYCRHVFGVLPSSQETQLGWPFAGWVVTFQKAQAMVFDTRGQIGMTTVALLTALGGLLVLGLVRAVRFRAIVDPLFILFAALLFCTNFYVLLFPKDLIRVATLTAVLLPFVVAGRTRPATTQPGMAAARSTAAP